MSYQPYQLCVISESVARCYQQLSYQLYQLCVISESVISYISWDLITPAIRLVTVRADIISAGVLGKLL